MTGMAGDVGLVILDCDGVLVDSERLTVEVEARMLSEVMASHGPTCSSTQHGQREWNRTAAW